MKRFLALAFIVAELVLTAGCDDGSGQLYRMDGTYHGDYKLTYSDGTVGFVSTNALFVMAGSHLSDSVTFDDTVGTVFTGWDGADAVHFDGDRIFGEPGGDLGTLLIYYTGEATRERGLFMHLTVYGYDVYSNQVVSGPSTLDLEYTNLRRVYR